MNKNESNAIEAVSLQSIKPFEGAHAIPGIRFRAVRAALDVTAWGMNVLELEPNNEGYPEHDHKKDGQEEVYFIVKGAVQLRMGEQILSLKEGDFVRVPPEVIRKFVTQDKGTTILALGATPGEAFKPTM